MKRIIAILALCTIWFVGCKEDAPIVNEPNTPDEPEVHAPIIKLSRNSVEVTAEGETINLSFTIENPVDGEKVEVSTEAEWVSNIIVGEEIMQFVVAQNTSEESRETLLTVEYEGADSCTITVTQSGIEPEPAPDPEPEPTPTPAPNDPVIDESTINWDKTITLNTNCISVNDVNLIFQTTSIPDDSSKSVVFDGTLHISYNKTVKSVDTSTFTLPFNSYSDATPKGYQLKINLKQIFADAVFVSGDVVKISLKDVSMKTENVKFIQ